MRFSVMMEFGNVMPRGGTDHGYLLYSLLVLERIRS